jgi:hypothetical protein
MYKLYLTVILIFHLVMLSFAGTADRSQPKPPSRSTRVSRLTNRPMKEGMVSDEP